MGDRANIKLQYHDGNSIYFYTHWNGYELPKTLQDALIRGKDRWNDEAYLSRIIFCEMIKNSIMDNTGYGISPFLCDNEYDIINVFLNEEKIVIDGYSFSFDEYIKIENISWDSLN